MQARSLLVLGVAGAIASFAFGQGPREQSASDPVSSRSTDLSRAVDLQIRGLGSSDAKVRADAARSLGRVRSKLEAAVMQIAGLLTDDDPQVRVAAADTLLYLEQPDLLPHFLRAIGDSDPRVQFRAAIAIHGYAAQQRLPAASGYGIGKIVVPDWYPRAVERAEKSSIRGLLALACEQPSPDIPAAIPVAMKCLGSGDHRLFAAAQVLLCDVPLGRPLAQCLTDDDVDIRRGAAQELYALESHLWEPAAANEIASPLSAGLEDRDAVVRLYCLLTLADHKKVAPDRFVSMTSDPVPTVRCAAVKALARRAPKDAFEVLSRMLSNDPSNRVRVRAAFAIASLSMPEERLAEQPAEAISGITDPLAKTLVAIALLHYSEGGEQQQGTKPDVGPNVEPAIARIHKAIGEERREPLPSISRSGDFGDTDGFDLELIAAIGAIGPVATQAVAWILADLERLDTLGDGDYRADAAGRQLDVILYALTNIGPTPELIRGLDHDHRVVRTVSAMALADQEAFSARTVPILIASLDQSCWGICGFSHTRRTDVACLAQMGHRSVAALVELIRTNRNPELAQEALATMGFDHERVVPLLVAVLKNKQEGALVRATITEVLGIVGVEDARALDVLKQLLLDLREPDAIRAAAAIGLGQTRAGEVIPLLRKCEDDASTEVRASVKAALSRAAANQQ